MRYIFTWPRCMGCTKVGINGEDPNRGSWETRILLSTIPYRADLFSTSTDSDIWLYILVKSPFNGLPPHFRGSSYHQESGMRKPLTWQCWIAKIEMTVVSAVRRWGENSTEEIPRIAHVLYELLWYGNSSQQGRSARSWWRAICAFQEMC